MNRNLRVVFSKAGGPGLQYTEIAHGTWFLGREPQLSGDAIPPEVLKGMEKQTPGVCDHAKGSIRYASGDVLYVMDFEAMGERGTS